MSSAPFAPARPLNQLASQKTARAAPARAGGDPQKIEQLPGRLDFQNSLSAFDLQARKIARRFGLADSTARAVATLAFAEEGARA
ncbi:MAG: hypothetical protein ACLPSW_12830 [Roseiarcus sp.]